MLTFEPKHTQPFTFEHACQLDAPTISEEISRLHNSLRVLSSTQKQLQEAIAAETTPDVDLQEAYRENLEVMWSQEERIVMLRKALEARGAAVADNPHYQVHIHPSSLLATPSEVAAPASRDGRVHEQTSNEDESVLRNPWLYAFCPMKGYSWIEVAMRSEDRLGIRIVMRSLITIYTRSIGRRYWGIHLTTIIMDNFISAGISIFDRINLSPLLLNLPRNPAVAVGLPIILGSLSGYPTAKVVKSGWYEEGLRAKRLGLSGQYSMGYASHLAIKTYDTSLSPAIKDAALTGLKMYWVQLGLNLATDCGYLGMQKGIALIDIAALTSTVAAMTHTLHEPTGGTSTYLLAPYCAWLSFATYLNGGYWWLNRGTPTGPATSFPRREE
ncbi:tspO/MBR family domain-containing protein [Rhizoctonia solani AG-1 IA]|uniref:TspO/MBR family domain-containing protein n=1 Tax=Thanatephorus cucumeris (strain AG1-IA) TaxID=983506 RepID=L8X9F8_THACA|nr:tspO/MBR family domain-containing protein [Rhizoctonia solani AG-1 IA]